ncbi:MAG: type IX secretion system membrane protein PorP/SprF, partial [Bacteroidia bacterium]|nr:type IX secretion system membrane protein PorP/SprF [Bacteroidia bacterium]
KGKMQGLRVGYSYDLTLSKILSVSSGTHELQLNYCFIVKIVPPEKINLVTPPFMHRESD